jgi:hypothetical protein
MTPGASDPRLYRPHVARNRQPILDVLRRVLPQTGLVLEIASGSGEHAIHFAAALPHLSWQPTDLDAEALASIAAHHTESGVANVLAPLALDVTARRWPVECADAIVCINMIHISPWSASEGLVAVRRARLLLAAFFTSMAPTASAASTPRRAIVRLTAGCGRRMRAGACAISMT